MVIYLRVSRKCKECNKEFTYLPIRKEGRKREFCSIKCRTKHDFNNRKDLPSYIQYRKNYVRQKRLVITINGKRKHILVNKRMFNGKCELCNRIINNRPQWHHWDDKHPELGLWVCYRCHRLCEAVEYDPINKLIEKYKRLKLVVENTRIT